jgi:uncharacterized protein
LSTGLIALLDDIAALSKMAAATLDDAAGQAAKASSKAAGIVIDDAAVTPRYVVGLAASRELPIIRKIAWGSIKNKTLFILPAALVLSLVAPWLITPILMVGGAYLAMEGYEKVVDYFKAPDVSGTAAEIDPEAGLTPEEIEDLRIGSAIRTDFILSAEIMAIALASLSTAPIWLQGIILFIVGIVMTIVVYGAVAIIVKADDVGVALAQSRQAIVRAIGRGIVSGMPAFLKVLSTIGMLAMLWVGGGIIIHGLYVLGVKAPEQTFHHAAETVAHLLPAGLQGFAQWLVQATLSGLVGLAIGAVVAPLAHRVILPMIARLTGKAVAH